MRKTLCVSDCVPMVTVKRVQQFSMCNHYWVFTDRHGFKLGLNNRTSLVNTSTHTTPVSSNCFMSIIFPVLCFHTTVVVCGSVALTLEVQTLDIEIQVVWTILYVNA